VSSVHDRPEVSTYSARDAAVVLVESEQFVGNLPIFSDVVLQRESSTSLHHASEELTAVRVSLEAVLPTEECRRRSSENIPCIGGDNERPGEADVLVGLFCLLIS